MNKQAQEAAGRLYQIAKDTEADIVAKVFAIQKISSDAPLDETVEIYNQIKDKWLTLVEVVSAISLTAEQKGVVEKFLVSELGEKIVVIFDVNPAIIGGLKVKIGDNIFDDSLASRIRDLKL